LCSGPVLGCFCEGRMSSCASFASSRSSIFFHRFIFVAPYVSLGIPTQQTSQRRHVHRQHAPGHSRQPLRTSLCQCTPQPDSSNSIAWTPASSPVPEFTRCALVHMSIISLQPPHMTPFITRIGRWAATTTPCAGARGRTARCRRQEHLAVTCMWT
jgi:hypothetical protein